MCIDCARRKLRRLKQQNPVPAAGWFLCIVDHDDHVHVRVNGGEQDDATAEWVQVPSPLEVFKGALVEMGIVNRIHLHEPEPVNKGCSQELVSSIPHVIFDGDAAASSSASEELCSICYDGSHRKSHRRCLRDEHSVHDHHRRGALVHAQCFSRGWCRAALRSCCRLVLVVLLSVPRGRCGRGVLEALDKRLHLAAGHDHCSCMADQPFSVSLSDQVTR